MNLTPTATSVPAAAVLVAGVGSQLVDDAAFFLFPPLGVLGWLGGLIAILLTAGAARFVTRGMDGASVARSGLAVGATSAVVGLLVGGLGLVAILLAAVTVVAGVAGAVAGRATASREAA